MKFIRENNNLTKIEFVVEEDASLDEVLEDFQNFLRACGYVIEYNKVLDFVDMDE